MLKGVSESLGRQLEALESFTIDVIYERRDGRAERLYALFLRTLSMLFEGISRARLWLYRKRVLRNSHLGCLVVVVGNLTVGGTGKTPVVEKLARSLHGKGRKVAILSRGYKSKKEPLVRKWLRAITHAEPEPPRVVSDGEQVLLDSEVSGDEPYMLASNLPGVLVIVDKDRVKAGRYAIRQFGADTLILDDGFQYFKLKDHLQLLLVDKTNPFGNGHLLPRGILREPIRHLKRASYIFLTKSDGKADPELEAIIRRHKPDAEIIECTHRPQYIHEVNGTEQRPLDALSGTKVAAFCAIAVPESFEKFLIDQQAEVVTKKWFLDHHRFSTGELDKLFRQARDAGAEMIVTTEKDAVRIPPQVRPPIPMFYLRVEIDILRGADDFDEAVSRICFKKQRLPATRPPIARRQR